MYSHYLDTYRTGFHIPCVSRVLLNSSTKLKISVEKTKIKLNTHRPSLQRSLRKSSTKLKDVRQTMANIKRRRLSD